MQHEKGVSRIIATFSRKEDTVFFFFLFIQGAGEDKAERAKDFCLFSNWSNVHLHHHMFHHDVCYLIIFFFPKRLFLVSFSIVYDFYFYFVIIVAHSINPFYDVGSLGARTVFKIKSNCCYPFWNLCCSWAFGKDRRFSWQQVLIFRNWSVSWFCFTSMFACVRACIFMQKCVYSDKTVTSNRLFLNESAIAKSIKLVAESLAVSFTMSCLAILLLQSQPFPFSSCTCLFLAIENSPQAQNV